MTRYIVRRIITIIPMVWLVLTITFFLVSLAPGSPFTKERNLPAGMEERLKEKYGFDQPKIDQYFRFLKRLAGFSYNPIAKQWNWHPYPDFGDSTKYLDRTVNEIIVEALPVSAFIGIIAYAFAACIGITLGVLAAGRRNSWMDHLATIVATGGVSIPAFVLGPLLVLMLSLNLYLLPPARIEWVHWGSLTLPQWRFVVLPAITLSMVYIAYIARITRTAMVGALDQDYVRTAKAKGGSPFRILIHHAFRSAMLPVVSFTGPALAY